MSDVTNIDDYRPHETGWVQCGECKHWWIAVAPVVRDAGGLECPQCHAMAGEFKERTIEPSTPPLGPPQPPKSKHPKGWA